MYIYADACIIRLDPEFRRLPGTISLSNRRRKHRVDYSMKIISIKKNDVKE